jgi:hypothetical protein
MVKSSDAGSAMNQQCRRHVHGAFFLMVDREILKKRTTSINANIFLKNQKK